MSEVLLRHLPQLPLELFHRILSITALALGIWDVSRKKYLVFVPHCLIKMIDSTEYWVYVRCINFVILGLDGFFLSEILLDNFYC